MHFIVPNKDCDNSLTIVANLRTHVGLALRHLTNGQCTHPKVLQMQEQALTDCHPSAAQNGEAYLQLLRRWREKVGPARIIESGVGFCHFTLGVTFECCMPIGLTTPTKTTMITITGSQVMELLVQAESNDLVSCDNAHKVDQSSFSPCLVIVQARAN